MPAQPSLRAVRASGRSWATGKSPVVSDSAFCEGQVSPFAMSRIVLCAPGTCFPRWERCGIINKTAQMCKKRKCGTVSRRGSSISAKEQAGDKGEKHVVDSLSRMWKIHFR